MSLLRLLWLRAVANKEKYARDTETLVAEFGAARVVQWWASLYLLVGIGLGMFFTAMMIGERSQVSSVLMLTGLTMVVVSFLSFFYTEIGREFRQIAADKAFADWRGGMGDMTDAEWDANMEYLARTAANPQTSDADADWFFNHVATVIPRDTKGWVVVYQKKIVAVGKTLKEALEKADLPPGAEPFVVQWPLRGCVDTRH